MGFQKTVTNHLRNMTLNFGKTCMPWGVKRSVCAGCSGVLFALPGVVAFREHDPLSTYILAAFITQALLSVMSDYVCTGRDSVWHGLDRWMSSVMTVSMVWYAQSALSPKHCAIAVPPLFCLYQSKNAIARGDWSAYVVWHTLWHLSAVFGCCGVIYLVNGWQGVHAVGRGMGVTRLGWAEL
jgi:hypothetical protein